MPWSASPRQEQICLRQMHHRGVNASDMDVWWLQIIWMAATQGSSIQQILLAAAQSGTQSPQLLEQLNLLQSRQPVALMPEIQVGISCHVPLLQPRLTVIQPASACPSSMHAAGIQRG